MRKAVFLDRDGVLNRAVVRDGRPYPPQTLGEVEILPGVGAAVQALRQAGFFLAVVTNQPDVARGTQSMELVEAINRQLGAALGIDHFEVCYHDDVEDCPCRKPKPGLLTSAAEACDLDLKRSFLVGDRWRDVAAGLAAGCRTVWIDYGYSERQPTGHHHRAGSLLRASQWILGQADGDT